VFAFSAADPFERLDRTSALSCRVDPLPGSSVPLLLISRACDIVTCSDEQWRRVEQEGRTIGPFPDGGGHR
jgi:hypothetical protein